MSRKSDYISIVRQNTLQMWNAMNTLKSLQLEWNSLDYGNTGVVVDENDDPILDGAGNPIPLGLGDGDGDNSGITQGEVGAVVFATTDAILGLMAEGHGTNMANLL